MEFHVLFTIQSKCIVTERGLMISHYQTGKLSLNGRRITLTMLQSKCISNTKDHLFKHFISVLPTKRISLQFRQRNEAIPPFFILFLPGSLPTIITLLISKNAKKDLIVTSISALELEPAFLQKKKNTFSKPPQTISAEEDTQHNSSRDVKPVRFV